MLHIFNGAPVVKDCFVQTETTSKPLIKRIWKTSKYKKSNLIKENTFEPSSESSCSTDLHFEYNCTQLSNNDPSKEERKKIDVDIQYHPENFERTSADNFFRQINMESQCLLDSEKYLLENISNKSIPDRFFDCHEEIKEEKDNEFCLGGTKRKISCLEPPSEEIDPSITIIEETPTESLINTNCTFCLANRLSANQTNLTYCKNNQTIINTTLIDDAATNLSLSNIFVVVLQTFPSKKIVIKQGIHVGETMDLASINVGDESTFFTEITLLKESAAWVDRLFVGDVILLTDISFRSFQNRNVGKTNKQSKIFNFHRPQHPYPENWSSILCMRKLDSFIKWVHREHKYLHSPALRKDFKTVTLFSEMTCEHVRNIQAKIIDFSVHENKSDFYKFLGVCVPKVAIELQDMNSLRRNLFIWGDMYKHLERIKTSINKDVYISHVMQSFDKTANVYSLHTTSQSTIQFVNYNDNNNLMNSLCTIDSFCFETSRGSDVYISSTNFEDFEDIESILCFDCSSCHSKVNIGNNGGNLIHCNTCGIQNTKYRLSRFSLTVRKINTDSSLSIETKSETEDEIRSRNSFRIVVYPENAMKVFPKFLSLNSNSTLIDALVILKEDITSLINGKAFNFMLKNLSGANEQFSFIKEDIFEFVSMTPS